MNINKELLDELVKLKWLCEEGTEAEMWNCSGLGNSLKRFDNDVQKLLIEKEISINEFEKIVEEMEEKEITKIYYNQYDRKNNKNVFIYQHQIFGDIKFSYEYFLEKYKKEDIDLVIKCKDCGEYFILDRKERNFYETKNLSLPKRCHNCRSDRKLAKRFKDNIKILSDECLDKINIFELKKLIRCITGYVPACNDSKIARKNLLCDFKADIKYYREKFNF